MPRRKQVEADFDLDNVEIPQEIEASAPPDTILVRWADELLLLDAWNTEGVSSKRFTKCLWDPQ